MKTFHHVIQDSYINNMLLTQSLKKIPKKMHGYLSRNKIKSIYLLVRPQISISHLILKGMSPKIHNIVMK